MKNQREIYEALLSGETFIGAISGAKYRLNDTGDLICITADGEMSSTNLFIYNESYQIYKEPKWYENIPDDGVLCWHLDDTHRTPSAIYNAASMGNCEHMYTPLTKAEIQVFLSNVPEEE